MSIGKYTLVTDFTTANGGQCRWAFAKKDGKEYFIKEFLSPKYPTKKTPGSEKQKNHKLERCKAFENHHRTMMGKLRGISLSGGNLVITEDFFRYKTMYYKVTEKVDINSLSIEDISRLSFEEQIILAMTTVHSVAVLHQVGIVHGDLKPSNILIKTTSKGLPAAKLIDFDDSYESENPPSAEELVGDFTYYSPETIEYVNGKCNGKCLQTSVDVFALGIILHEYFTGKRPTFSPNRYKKSTVANGVLNNKTPQLSVDDSKIKTLIKSMLEKEYSNRPSAQQVIIGLQEARASHKKTSKSSTFVEDRSKEKELSDGKPADVRIRGSLLNAIEKAEDTERGISPEKLTDAKLRGTLIDTIKRFEESDSERTHSDESADMRTHGTLLDAVKRAKDTLSEKPKDIKPRGTLLNAVKLAEKDKKDSCR